MAGCQCPVVFDPCPNLRAYFVCGVFFFYLCVLVHVRMMFYGMDVYLMIEPGLRMMLFSSFVY